MQTASFRIVAFNDTYHFVKFPFLKVILQELEPKADAVVLAGDFLSPSVLTSIDKGRSMIDMLNRVGITHCCFGNHEADLQLPQLRQRIKESQFIWLNSNMPEFPSDGLEEKIKQYDILSSSCGRGKLALAGVIGDDRAMFPSNSFRNVPIAPVVDSIFEIAESLGATTQDQPPKTQDAADCIIPVTHQSMGADLALAELAFEEGIKIPCILGGHDHSTMTEGRGHTLVFKAGSDLATLNVIDLELSFNSEGKQHYPWIESHSIELDDVKSMPFDVSLDARAQEHLSIISALEKEAVLVPDPLRDYTMEPPLSSEGSRLHQTTIGGLFGDAVKAELNADVGFINGATIMGNRSYPNRKMTLLDLRDELPFPTKMVTVDLPGQVLQDTLVHSRTFITEKDRATAQEGTSIIERRGYLQMDTGVVIDETKNHEIRSINGQSFDRSKIYSVALPRNLTKGFCELHPLLEWAQQNPKEIPEEEAFIPALHLVLSYFMKERWRQLHIPFDEIDVDGSGSIDTDELHAALQLRYGNRQPDTLVAHMFGAADLDGDGHVSREEFESLVL